MDSGIFAVQLSDAISLNDCKRALPFKLLYSGRDELFYQVSEDRFMYIFRYGIAGFYNIPPEERELLIEKLLPFCKNIHEQPLFDDIAIQLGGKQNEVTYNSIRLGEFNLKSLRIIMLNIAQSVALDRFLEITESILKDTKEFTVALEKEGKLNISGKNLRKFIGRVLNMKNRITEYLYIFDPSELTWEDEKLNKLDQEIKQNFDLKIRYISINDRLGIIKENLDLFKDVLQHKESSRLEWIIIILILVEILHAFFYSLT